MAKIPVERKSGGDWWKWLLALLVLALLIWLVVELVDTDPEDEVVEEPTEQVEPVQDGPITSLVTITTASDWRSLLGREVQIDNLHVTRVPGDSTFFVSSGPGGEANEQVMVVLDEEMGSPPQNVEGRYDVNEGQTISILEGRIQELTETDINEWGLGPGETSILGERNFYIRAQRLNIVSQG